MAVELDGQTFCGYTFTQYLAKKRKLAEEITHLDCVEDAIKNLLNAHKDKEASFGGERVALKIDAIGLDTKVILADETLMKKLTKLGATKLEIDTKVAKEVMPELWTTHSKTTSKWKFN